MEQSAEKCRELAKRNQMCLKGIHSAEFTVTFKIKASGEVKVKLSCYRPGQTLGVPGG
jgi:hypothetical protein